MLLQLPIITTPTMFIVHTNHTNHVNTKQICSCTHNTNIPTNTKKDSFHRHSQPIDNMNIDIEEGAHISESEHSHTNLNDDVIPSTSTELTSSDHDPPLEHVYHPHSNDHHDMCAIHDIHDTTDHDDILQTDTDADTDITPPCPPPSPDRPFSFPHPLPSSSTQYQSIQESITQPNQSEPRQHPLNQNGKCNECHLYLHQTNECIEPEQHKTRRSSLRSLRSLRSLSNSSNPHPHHHNERRPSVLELYALEKSKSSGSKDRKDGMIQALLYIATFIGCYTMEFIQFGMGYYNHSVPYRVVLLNLILYPLQGFVFMLIFIRPRVMKLKRRHGSYSTLKLFRIAIMSQGSDSIPKSMKRRRSSYPRRLSGRGMTRRNSSSSLYGGCERGLSSVVELDKVKDDTEKDYYDDDKDGNSGSTR